MFAGSRSAAEDPLRAARVYDDIAAAILEAEEAAKKAKQDSNNAIHIVSSVKPALKATCIKQLPLLRGHIFRSL